MGPRLGDYEEDWDGDEFVGQSGEPIIDEDSNVLYEGCDGCGENNNGYGITVAYMYTHGENTRIVPTA